MLESTLPIWYNDIRSSLNKSKPRRKCEKSMLNILRGGAVDVKKVRDLRKGTGSRKQRIPLEQTHEKKVECEYPDCKNQR